ncbi:hypothetical protein E2C01_041660 [Portunus trituberculatus]|uniref:Uncharacterized protein n=1 Tax=Portunus trituberculatus TaxID=210409 RepID=A0A5B7FRL7_PORTR|nr:hypothetical protein [Portunus trituberculatus]
MGAHALPSGGRLAHFPSYFPQFYSYLAVLVQCSRRDTLATPPPEPQPAGAGQGPPDVAIKRKIPTTKRRVHTGSLNTFCLRSAQGHFPANKLVLTALPRTYLASHAAGSLHVQSCVLQPLNAHHRHKSSMCRVREGGERAGQGGAEGGHG